MFQFFNRFFFILTETTERVVVLAVNHSSQDQQSERFLKKRKKKVTYSNESRDLLMLKRWGAGEWWRGLKKREEMCFMQDGRKPALNTGDLANLD